MASTELSSIDISSLQNGYSEGTFSPAQIVSQLYTKISSYSDKAVWIHLIPALEAVAYAESLPSKFPDSKPPLYGIPFSVKDSIDIADLPTTLACPSFSYIAERTAPVVQKCLDAGGILIGKTNLDQFATGLVGHRSAYGTPRCVFDAEYISGGSSSGSAVSVGAGLVSFSIGTDTAGSTRVPAALNGLVGLKPSLYSLSTVGLVPACKTADCITVLAKNMKDAEAAWGVMKGYDPQDVYARASPPQWGPWPESGNVKFGIPPPELLKVLSPEYSILYNAAIKAAPSIIGGTLREFDYSPFENANNMLYGSSIVAQRLVAFDSYLAEHGMDKLHPVIKSIFTSSSGFSAVQAYQDIFTLALYRRQAELEFKKIDILILPSTVTHWKVEEIDVDPLGRNKILGSFTHFVNLLDLCAVSVPAGWWTNGSGRRMPFGVTVVAQAGRDREIMGVGRKIMEGLGT